MRFKLTVLFTAIALLGAPLASAGNTCLIVGDSLSKEYSVEGPVLWNTIIPFDPLLDARNWMEILISKRGSDFDFGAYSSLRMDSRTPAGHDHNWAVPGSTTTEWRGALNGASLLEKFALANFDSDLRNNADRVVVFLGGNDLNNNYNTYYNGADPAAFIASLLSNYAFIVQHIQTVNSTAQIVICTAPDVGVTPSVRSGHPDPAKRALVTSLTETLNAGIAQLAAQQGLGFADIYAFTKLYAAPGTIAIAGIPLVKGTSNQNDPNDLFSADGFHPNTPAQALIANEIIRAFNNKFQDGIAPLTGSQIMGYLESQHGVTMDKSYSDWTTSYGLAKKGKLDDPDNDGLSNALEYALGLDPSKPGNNAMPTPQIMQVSGTSYLTLTYSPRWRSAGHETITPQSSTDLSGWSAAGPAVNNGDGSFTARIPLNGSARFLRLNISVGN
jgi:lysophospholipase L1-like esterase